MGVADIIPRWHNIPPSSPKAKEHGTGYSLLTSHVETFDNTENYIDDVDPEDHSRPSDFNTFVPSHDPSLRPATPHAPSFGHAHISAQHESGRPVTQDEAFDRALQAMYWSGYWTAAYHASISSFPTAIHGLMKSFSTPRVNHRHQTIRTKRLTKKALHKKILTIQMYNAALTSQ